MMAPRASARAAARKQAYATSRRSTDDQSHSPEARRVRSTRSQSKDLDASDTDRPATARVRRSARRASIDSDASIPNSVSESQNNDDRRGKNRGGQESADLSVVNEDEESEGDGEGQEAVEPEDVDHQLEAQLLSSAPPPQSPLLSESDGVYDSDENLDEEGIELGSILVQLLPDLLASSVKVIGHLAPGGITTQVVESIAAELRRPHSFQAIRFHRDEQAFQNDRKFYGKNPYINLAHIYIAIFGMRAEEIMESELEHAPDAILYVANIASLLRDIFTTERDSEEMRNTLLRVDPLFPESFLRGFHPDAKSGDTSHEDLTFELSLEIRTQCIITALIMDSEVDPERALLSLFFHDYTARRTGMSYFEETLKHGQPLEMMRNVSTNSREQDALIRSRVREIQLAFRTTDGETEVDFPRLEEMFPWTGFLEQLATWARKRVKEIRRDIRPPEGVDYIIQSITKAINSDGSEADPADSLASSPPAAGARHPQTPSRTIIPSTAGQNLYSSAQNVLALEKLKRDMGRAGQAKAPLPRTVNRASETMAPVVDDTEPRPAQEYVDAFIKFTREGNKENRPSHEPSSTRNPTQKTAAHSSPGGRKRRRPDVDEEDEEDAFEADDRAPDPRRRKSAPVPQNRRPVSRGSSPPERVRHFPAPQVIRERFVPPPMSGTNEVEEDEDDDASVPTPSFKVVSMAARRAVMANTRPAIQRRVPWSVADEDRFRQLIEEHGPRWSHIEAVGGFQTPRGQVALKDKARNMKVSYLKAGVPLPHNFDGVSLGAKEIRIIQSARPDWQPH